MLLSIKFSAFIYKRKRIMRPHVAILYPSGIPSTPFQEFADAFDGENVSVHLEEREFGGQYAGIMWTMLTGAAVFIASSYIGGMLKELGKDHYEKLKKSLAKLSEDTMSIPRIEPVLIGTSGKVKDDDPISMAFSVWGELGDGRGVKLLLPKKVEGVDYGAATSAFLDFIVDFNERGEDALIETGLDLSRRVNPITVIYNPEAKRIEWANPFPH